MNVEKSSKIHRVLKHSGVIDIDKVRSKQNKRHSTQTKHQPEQDTIHGINSRFFESTSEQEPSGIDNWCRNFKEGEVSQNYPVSVTIPNAQNSIQYKSMME